jgi:hypothetical protein
MSNIPPMVRHIANIVNCLLDAATKRGMLSVHRNISYSYQLAVLRVILNSLCIYLALLKFLRSNSPLVGPN